MTCKYYEPDHWWTNPWGFIGDTDEFARCGLSGTSGYKSFCSTQRTEFWPPEVATCDRSGRAWEPKDE